MGMPMKADKSLLSREVGLRLAVVAIIALIAVLVTPEVMRAQVRAKVASETENLRMI